MHQGGFRRWLLLPGALAAAALLGTACERDRPKPGGAYEGVVNDQQPTESFVPGSTPPEHRAKDGWVDPGSKLPPDTAATGGSGIGNEQQGANPTPDEFRRPQQVPVQEKQDRTGAEGSPGAEGSSDVIGAPGFTTPEVPPSSDKGGSRELEAQRTVHHSHLAQEPELGAGPNFPPKADTAVQAPKK
ncbi:hypothetical protein JY651_47370 [Pyxidicoccus parkwayensis]|uniref:Lipoprotein n=1 Tax=Pyxidicoccus parkwayensis TaxID=2813578 RepID=A0ABX7NUR8_9BACT|nr:hypothetical protein [Pyxidicoccus parkwaysis]QSQ22647.1 hypothetical protein JY651_47370 [Pyxidicoccus parkwaysis]